MTVLELLSKNKNNPRASDHAMLLWLYNRWKSDEGQALQRQLERREVERNTSKAIFLYDSSSFKYIFEEAANDCVEIANEEVFTHWFGEEDVTGRLIELLCISDNEEKVLFRALLRSLGACKALNSITIYLTAIKIAKTLVVRFCGIVLYV